MVTEVYSHILDEDRKINAQKFEDSFYKNSSDDNSHQSNVKQEINVESLADALRANPDLMAQLVEALQ